MLFYQKIYVQREIIYRKIESTIVALSRGVVSSLMIGRLIANFRRTVQCVLSVYTVSAELAGTYTLKPISNQNLLLEKACKFEHGKPHITQRVFQKACNFETQKTESPQEALSQLLS